MRKKILIILIINFFFLACIISETFKGLGIHEAPYLISTYNDLKKLRDIVNSGNIEYASACYRQTCDIVFPDGINWNPIGNLREGIIFRGEYNGDGHTISDINCEAEYAGFFEFLGGTVYNLGIESGSFKGDCIGSITSHGTAEGKIINCYNKAELYAKYRAGGICDNFDGLLLFCYNFGDLNAFAENSISAGISSYGKATIRNCYSTNTKIVDFSTYKGDISDAQIITEDTLKLKCLLNSIYQKYTTTFPSQLPNTPQVIIDIAEKISLDEIRLPISKNGFRFSDDNREVFTEAKNNNKQDYIERQKNKYSFDGKGTRKNPYKITKYEDLCLLRDNVNMGCLYDKVYFEQTSDLSFPNGNVWKPIGDVQLGYAFKGIYDGKGHSIKNVICYDQFASIFGLLDGEIKNLYIDNCFFYGSTIGTIVSHGLKNAHIENIVNNSTEMVIYRGGGICDNFNGEIKNCHNKGKLIAIRDDSVLAGITSYGYAKIENCESEYLPEIVDFTFYGTISKDTKKLENRLRIFASILIILLMIFDLTYLLPYIYKLFITKNNRLFCKKIISFTLTTVIFFVLINHVFVTPLVAGVLQFQNYKKKENKFTNVLFMGGSTMSCNFELTELWKNYGIAGFCGGSGSASIEDTYYRLRILQKIHPVKNVVVEVAGARFKNEYGDIEQKLNNISGIPFCIDKIRYIWSACDPKERFNYLLAIPNFHDKWKCLSKYNFLRSSELGDSDKGTWTVMHDNLYKPILVDACRFTNYEFLDEKQEYYLRKIIEYCNDNNLSLVFIKSIDAARWQNQAIWNTVSQIAEEENIPFLDFNYLDEEIGIQPEDFYYDDRHLTVTGARKNIPYLTNFMNSYFELQNMKDNPDYNSWNKFVENRESLYLNTINNIEEYLKELAKDEKTSLIIPYKVDERVVNIFDQFPALYSVNIIKRDFYLGDNQINIGNTKVNVLINYDGIEILTNKSKYKKYNIIEPGYVLITCDYLNEQIADIILIPINNNETVIRNYAVLNGILH